MSMTTEKRQEQLDVIQRTGGNREVMLSQRVIPDNYLAYAKQIEREEQTLALPGAEVPVRIIVSKALDREPGCPVHVNFHGGGFILPQNEDDDLYCARIAAGIHGIVVDVDYATSDKHPFPAAYDQSYAAVKWAFTQCAGWEADPRRVSVGGHSAGGNLAAAVSMKAARTGEFKLCMQILDYAANDNYMAVIAEDREQWARCTAFSLLYADGDVELLQKPVVSPIFASPEDLKNQPYTLIVEAGQCPFRNVNREYEEKLLQAGNRVERVEFPNSRHGFSVRMLDEWQEAQQAIVDAINACPAVE